MSGIKKVSPLLDEFTLGKPFSEHSGVVCYPAIHSVTKEKFILKCVSVPESQTKVDGLILTGACLDRAAAQTYYEEMAQSLVQQAEALKKLSQTRGFAPFYDYQLTPKDGGETGMDLWLLSPYRKTLDQHMKKGAMTHLEAVNLGIDLCAALTLCRKAGYVYQNLRPENIFLTPSRKFQLGDLGLLPIEEMAYAMLPDRYRNAYTAPELMDPLAELNDTMDIYALGMVLYQVYNEGILPGKGGMPEAPAHSDEEMSGIILKAIALLPEDRWQNPGDMGQALVSYMQKNPVNDAPIVPIPQDKETQKQEIVREKQQSSSENGQETSEDPALTEQSAENKEDREPDEGPDLIPEVMASDEGPDLIPEVMAADEGPDLIPEVMAADEGPDLIPEVMAADEGPDLIPEVMAADDDSDFQTPLPEECKETPAAGAAEDGHETEPAEESETEDENQPEIQSHEGSASNEPDESEKGGDTQTQEEPERVEEDDMKDILSRADSFLEENPQEQSEKEQEQTDEVTEASVPQEKKFSIKGFVIALCLIAVLAVAVMGGYYVYENVYCVPVQSFQVVESTLDTLTVEVKAESPDEAFHLSCQDTFGNSFEAEFHDGRATFTGLQPNTQYLVTINARGLHRLVGNNTVSYTTAIQTDITAFSAITGSEDGSAVLTFTPNGTEPENWLLTCSAQDEEDKQISFTGHSVTVTGLTVGKEYTFTLAAENEQTQEGANQIALSGTSSITFKAMPVITAQNLTLSAYSGETMTLAWDEPQEKVSGWTVQYYSGQEEPVSVQTETCSAVLENMDPSKAYNVEVTAEGMTQKSAVSMTANPVLVQNIKFDTETAGKLTMTWEYAGKDPENWLVTYSYGENTEASVAVQAQECTVTIDPVLPQTAYRFQIQPADGSTAFGGSQELTTGEAPSLDAFGITAADVAISLFPAPEKENWGVRDADVENQTDSFKKDQKLGFMMEIIGRYSYTNDDVSTLILVRDSEEQPVDFSYDTVGWHTMWTDSKYVGELPRMPETPGSYNLEIYFNGQMAKAAAFTVTE